MKNPLLHIVLFLLLSGSVRSQAPGDALSYEAIFPHGQCHPEAFALAVRGHAVLKEQGLLKVPRYLTIVDFSRPSNEPRLFVVDTRSRMLLLSSITAHGVGSDPDSTALPYRFSNTDKSRMSSVGFYITGSTYTNHRPDDSLALCLFGVDQAFNDAAALREIVIHYGATEYTGRVYVTDSGAARSYGCPALPLSTNSRVINTIKGGSCLFIYSNKVTQYAQKSTVLNGGVKSRIRQKGPAPNFCSCDLQPRRPATQKKTAGRNGRT